MLSKNFEILRNQWPELADLGGFAEQYAYPDPTSALVKLRTLSEEIVLAIFQTHSFEMPYQTTLNDLLNEASFKKTVPVVIMEKFHTLRRHGNKAAHGGRGTTEMALGTLQVAYDIGRWFFLTYGKGKKEVCSAFQPPSLVDTKGQLKREKRAALEKLAVQESRMTTLLEELKEARVQAKAAKRTAAELQVYVDAGRQSANELEFDEETTRLRLIDSMLAEASWNVGANGENTDEVGQEIEVKHQPTETGIGYADYVLWDDNGKPLAVVEAKKTAEDVTKGKTQARIYADGLEKMHNQRPVIFYTNGFDIHIWDDAQNSPPRKIYGFYSKESLKYLVTYQRNEKKDLDTIPINNEITDRIYQHEAIKRIMEKFTTNHRKALLVQATGTGKTRVAISITDLLMRASWVKRVLFLCDRKELRKQAKNTFTNHLPHEPLTIVRASTAKDRNKRIYLATYPAMARIFQTFDVGFFDLIIADESHRSIYNRYRDFFSYFDCLQVGLTATPVEFVHRNTFKLFGCQDKDPTAHYSLELAIEEEHLVPYEVYTHTTNFLRWGIKYKDFSTEQIKQLEEDGEEPEFFDHDAKEVDKQIFNKETNRKIIRNLMEKGIKDATGQLPGKSIIFARNHKHAVLLKELFDEMYPQYGGNFCQVIDTYDPRAEQLIDDFKSVETKDEITIAISVDMLDTGIDVPEIVNLTFAKPVKSKVKFDQMIGRGTRLRKDLFGAGKDKKMFRIFDHWQNFEDLERQKKEADPGLSKSLLQILFEMRLTLAETALKKSEPSVFNATIKLIQALINGLPEKTIAVREKWKETRALSQMETLNQFGSTTVNKLKTEIAPLMQWLDIRGFVDAYQLDKLITGLEINLLNRSGEFDDKKAEFLDGISRLQRNLTPVRAAAATLKEVEEQVFWDRVSYYSLEKTRKELRGIWKYQLKEKTGGADPKIIDIADGGEEFNHRPTKISSVDMMAYKKRVEEALLKHFETNTTLKKISRGEKVSKTDIDNLVSLILTQNPGVDMTLLKEFYKDRAFTLEFYIRSIIGMEPEIVKNRFSEFVQTHPTLTADQTRFLSLLQNHICKYGSIEIDRLYEAPFTAINSEGPDGVFSNETDVDDLMSIIETFQPPRQGDTQAC